MKSYFKYIFIAFFLINFAPLFAQQQIKGVVLESTDKGNFIPVAGATVYWLGTSIGTSTDTSGVFNIKHNPNLSKLIISFVGLKSDTLLVSEQNMQNIRVILKNESQLEEVSITAERQATTIDYLNPMKTNVMTEKELFKAACCNLSESFETNPSVDVNFSDAVTGAKQIQMLGLAGTYTQITTENLPDVRGLAANYGLSFIPGSWIESIQVTKGIGSVANGYESMAGQINTELRKPFGEDKIFFNAYANNWGRYEANLNFNQKIGKNWGTTLLLHNNNWIEKMDMNHDNFMDLPIGKQFNVINRWHFDNSKGISAQIGVKAMKDDRTGGQFSHDPKDIHTGHFPLYEVKINTERLEAWGKFGYVFPQQKYKSIGLMASVLDYSQNSGFGFTTYNAKQQSIYSNLIYQSIINNTNHKFRTGLSFIYDKYDETFNQNNYKRTEIVGGSFFEYTFSQEKFNVVAGIRTDFHNLFGLIVTPRLHAKYDFSPTTVLRISAGRGQRTANIFAENSSVFASSRKVEIQNNGQSNKAYGLNPETAWNFGINLTKEFRLFNREATLELDYYRTDFGNQVVVDLDNHSQKVLFYNLQGQSYSNSVQAQIAYEPLKNMEIRLAYRLFDVKTTYSGQLLDRYLLARDRAFVNISYKTENAWNFDYTLTWFGRKRIPNTLNNPEEFRKNTYSPDYFTMNMQVSKSFFENLDVYLGVENILDFRQTDLIVNAQSPFEPYFDASLVWGNIQGRMIYGGLRYRIKNKK
ncbi:MAG: TonB-dependent receptor [Bacteroidetes bacterium]|nr:MAG: TonB-dependent receptor [Bacteroidota bacterium]